MNQIATGTFIARKRRELNLTQAQLAERLGISSKSVSKWERGKCMPDYSIVNELCDALGITVSEPVSYTHLDVYKRQPHRRPEGEARGAQEEGRLAAGQGLGEMCIRDSNR